MGTTIDTTQCVGMDFDDPNLDMEGIAAGFGAHLEAIGSPAAVGELLGRAMTHPGPSFITIERER